MKVESFRDKNQLWEQYRKENLYIDYLELTDEHFNHRLTRKCSTPDLIITDTRLHKVCL